MAPPPLDGKENKLIPENQTTPETALSTTEPSHYVCWLAQRLTVNKEQNQLQQEKLKFLQAKCWREGSRLCWTWQTCLALSTNLPSCHTGSLRWVPDQGCCWDCISTGPGGHCCCPAPQHSHPHESAPLLCTASTGTAQQLPWHEQQHELSNGSASATVNCLGKGSETITCCYRKSKTCHNPHHTL